jgi:hypothetical protein
MAFRLFDVIHVERKLYLVFEFLDLDLKRLMDTTPDFHKDVGLIKASLCMNPMYSADDFQVHLASCLISRCTC